jgi:hypothetical protein
LKKCLGSAESHKYPNHCIPEEIYVKEKTERMNFLNEELKQKVYKIFLRYED